MSDGACLSVTICTGTGPQLRRHWPEPDCLGAACAQVSAAAQGRQHITCRTNMACTHKIASPHLHGTRVSVGDRLRVYELGVQLEREDRHLSSLFTSASVHRVRVRACVCVHPPGGACACVRACSFRNPYAWPVIRTGSLVRKRRRTNGSSGVCAGLKAANDCSSAEAHPSHQREGVL